MTTPTEGDRARPFDDRGRFVPVACPRPTCGAGTLRYEGNGVWACDGLEDPNDDRKELDVCHHIHIDGEPFYV